jgi:diguanylate cyclase (GGDEF)-like protein/PAS domain S-box-containing protein
MQLENGFFKELINDLYDGVYFVDPQRKFTYWNNAAERITGYKSQELLSKHCYDNILMHVNEEGIKLCRSECPLEQTLKDGKLREAKLYLHHKEGHRVPVLIRISPIYNGEKKILGAFQVFNDISSKIASLQRIEELEKFAYIDPLTGLANRRFIQNSVRSRQDEYNRYGWCFGVIFIDIDYFKAINDRYGHDIGDRVLKMVAKTMVLSTRSFDVIGRWGGEEFIAILANVNQETLGVVANRLRMLVENSILEEGKNKIQVTISLGATLAKPKETMETLFKRADELLYQSKTKGRNCITFEEGVMREP